MFLMIVMFNIDSQLAQQFSGQKRRKWTQEEEKILRDEVNITQGMAVPTQKTCQDILSKHSSLLEGKSKVHIQNKYRQMIKKLD